MERDSRPFSSTGGEQNDVDNTPVGVAGVVVVLRLDRFGVAQYVWLHGECLPSIRWPGRECRHRIHFYHQPDWLGGTTLMHILSLFAALALVATGCVQHHWTSAEERRALGSSVESSTSFQKARADGGSRVFWMVEGTEPGYTDIYVGSDMGTHTCRSVTLRVLADGRVERQTYDSAGEILWIPDR